MEFSINSDKRIRNQRPYVLMTGSYSGTLSEEIIVLIRKLHSLDAWNHVINQEMAVHLARVPDLVSSKPQPLPVR